MASHSAVSMFGAGEGMAAANEVLAIVSHDLRSPLANITMAATLLGERERTEAERGQMIGVIQRASQNMERLIRDLLEVSTLEAGRTLRVEPVPCDLTAVLHEVGEGFAAEAAAKSRRVEVSVPEALPRVLADRDRVRQVLANLIGNAMKFTAS